MGWSLAEVAMKKRRLRLLRLLLVSLGTASGLVLLAGWFPGPPERSPLEAKYARVRLGMTPGEVDAIMGHYDTCSICGGYWEQEYGDEDEEWPNFSVRINFENCRVSDKHMKGQPGPTWLEKLRYRLGW
jgi:hypothetical protein